MTERTRKCCETCPGDDTCQHANVCMCGSPMGHSPYEGHPPTSMHDYYCEQVSVGENADKENAK